MKEKNKKGQFYLCASIIIIAVIIGFAAISNYSKITTSTKIYDLGEELKIESAEILDYGIYNELDEIQMQTLLHEFIESYALEEGKNLYFIFGNRNKITVVAYQELAESVEVFGDVSTPLIINEETFSQEFTPTPPWKIEVTIGGIPYEFKLQSGENFYFVISQEIEGEEHIYVSNE